jgi:hypothetical protein
MGRVDSSGRDAGRHTRGAVSGCPRRESTVQPATGPGNNFMSWLPNAFAALTGGMQSQSSRTKTGSRTLQNWTLRLADLAHGSVIRGVAGLRPAVMG